VTDPAQNNFDALATHRPAGLRKGLFSAFDGSLPP